MRHIKYLLLQLVILLPALLPGQAVFAQDLLSRKITVEAKRKPLGDVLNNIGKQGNFYFSYNSNIIKKDSLVTLTANNKTVKQALDMLLGENCQYKETDNYIIIQPADKEKWYTISGYITDAVTGIKVADASVFERQQLVTTLTDINGYFRLQLKDRERYAAAEIVVSKGFYTDTSLSLLKGYDQQLELRLNPADHTLPDIVITQYTNVERSWFGKFLFSNKLRKQSANLGKFFVDKPIQFSLTPGLGTHGKMSGQVTNKFSFNALGGYSAGVNGFELGGIFNIDKKDVRYAQVGGIFNIVSGGVTGVQIAGIANTVSKSVKGVQVSGIASRVADSIKGVAIAGIVSHAGGNLKGIQIAGIMNLIANRDSMSRQTDTIAEAMRGMQIAGIANVVNGHSHGMQLSGIANITRGDVIGVQMSGIFNGARRVRGSQIGLINIADTVTGYCFGIINIVKHGYHLLALSSDEVFNFNAAYKAGTHRLYSVLRAGTNLTPGNKMYIIGYGIGTEFILSKRLSISTEFTAQNVFPATIERHLNYMRLEPSLNMRLFKKIFLFAGPAISFCPATQPTATGDSFLDKVPAGALYDLKTGGTTAAWIGWHAGIHFF